MCVFQTTFESCGSEAEALCGLNSTSSCSDDVCEDSMICCHTSCGPLCVDRFKLRLQTDRVDDTPTSKYIYDHYIRRESKSASDLLLKKN